MAAAKKWAVKAPQIVVKVEGAQGGEVYLRKGRVLPATVKPEEVKRLASLGLVVEVKESPKEQAPGGDGGDGGSAGASASGDSGK
ncbi:hypothetical protein [Serinibacter salmoneus]|uniref:Mu-like prophage FluMu N-terminal domain-containing protein n=1 Tax=Serinibacter salmoneus TaxID=556530 RepID=A0A2A9D1Y7_9MICO|nr:hypothetical protein [Serinibacter salmoneus]PFG19869.1 hypothetical protein ATL40_1445 [Serinibacter salmoneus]